MTEDLDKKVVQSIKLLQTTCKDRGVVEIAYSGGKDSDIILQLAKEAGISFKAIYKATTIDPAGTIAHAREMGAEILFPKLTFFQLISKKGFPHRMRRFCCKELKEYKVSDTAIIGIRKSESIKRCKRYKEPTQCRIFSKKEKVYQIYPILEWTDKNVEDFIKERKLKVHPLYYDEDGKFRVERRLGCLGCPLQSVKSRRGFFLKNPRWLKAYINAYNKSGRNDVYERLVRDLFDVKIEDTKGLFPIDCDEFIKKYFNI